MIDLGRRLRLVQELVDGEPQDQPIEHVHPLDAPVLGRLGDQRIDVGDRLGDAVRQARRKRAQVVAERLDCRRPVRPERLADFEHRDLARLPIDRASAPPLRGRDAATSRAGRSRRSTLGTRRHPPIASSRLAEQRCHLQRPRRRLAPFVAGTAPRALHRLLVGQRRQHAERHRHTGRRRCLHDAVRSRLGNVFEVHRVALDQAAEADDRVVLAALGQPLRGDRDLEGAGHANDRDVLVAHRRLGERARARPAAGRR